jgi:PrtD family type I secretion system ABC transporter
MASPTKRARPNPLSEALLRCRRGLVAVVFFSFAINMLLLTAPLYMLQVFDRVLTSRSVNTLLYLTLVATFAFLILWGLEIVRGRVMVSLGTWLDRRVGGEVLAASLGARLGQRTSSIQPVRDIGVVRTFLTGPGIFPILDAPWTPVFLAVVFLLQPILGWIGLFGAVVLFFFALANDLSTRGPLVRAGQISSSAFDEAQAAARNADVIEAMGMMPNVVSRWIQSIDGSLVEQARASRISGLITSSSKFVRQTLQIAILGVGAWLVLGNELSPGGMIAGSILIARALAPVEQAIGSWRGAIGARAAYSRVKRVLALAAQPDAAEPLPEPEGSVSAEGVSFAYPGEKEPFLRNIGFELKPGESLGLIGPTASGKTTLARILVGTLKPQLGHARLDGVDVAEWDARDRGQYVGYLPQDIELFSGSVRENIARLGQGDAEGVYAAARLTGVHEDILALPSGYDTEIGVGGMALSGGQRQRIGFARAVYGDPRLVVLDEPNSNLDVTGEKALLVALTHLREKGSTVVIIAHRPGVLRSVDKILVLRQGSMDMFGPRDEVLTKLGGTKAPASPPKQVGAPQEKPPAAPKRSESAPSKRKSPSTRKTTKRRSTGARKK